VLGRLIPISTWSSVALSPDHLPHYGPRILSTPQPNTNLMARRSWNFLIRLLTRSLVVGCHGVYES
jgi:hypothetical protein